MCSSDLIFRAHAGEAAVLATRGNLNTDIGVAMTLLGLAAGHRYCALELGMNHPGEIAQLADIARPTVALVNNAQREHQEFMQALTQAISDLPEREQLVMNLYYVEELNLKEIGEVLEVTESRVSQLLSAVVKKLRTNLHIEPVNLRKMRASKAA